jgi:hypothetical protein
MVDQVKKQQAIFPDLPRDDQIVDMKTGELTDHWLLFLQQLVQALQTNFKPEGIVIPPQIASNIALLTGLTSYNNIVFDSTNGLFKGNIAGTWKTFTLT